MMETDETDGDFRLKGDMDMKCTVCGYDMPEGALFCGCCGHEKESEQQSVQNFKYCENCGSKMNINDKFCSNCGPAKQTINYTDGRNNKPKSHLYKRE